MEELLSAIQKLISIKGSNELLDNAEDTLKYYIPENKSPRPNAAEDAEKYNILGGLMASTINVESDLNFIDTITHLIEVKAVYMEHMEHYEHNDRISLMSKLISCFLTASILTSKDLEQAQVLAIMHHQSTVANGI